MKQLSIRAMILLVIAVASLLAIAQSAGYAVAAGIVLCLVIVACSILYKLPGHLAVGIRGCLGILGIVSIWFLAVDIYVYVDVCPTCMSRDQVVSYRIIGIPVNTKTEENLSDIQIVLTDLDSPCQHANASSFPLQRWWGLWIVACPDFRGTFGLVSDSTWYDDESRKKIERAALDDNDFAKRMTDLVEQEKYSEFWAEFDKIIE